MRDTRQREIDNGVIGDPERTREIRGAPKPGTDLDNAGAGRHAEAALKKMGLEQRLNGAWRDDAPFALQATL